jgi:hypothetical protein
MDQATKAAAATFNQNYTVKLLRPLNPPDKLYSTLANDYTVDLPPATTSATVLAKNFTFYEKLDYNLPLTLTLLGGQNDTFTGTTGYTTVVGYLKIRNGRINASLLKIQP